MVKAKAIKAIHSNNEIVAYELKDENGLVMQVDCNKIIDAITNKAINIVNLSIKDGKLVMLNKEDNIDRMRYLVSILNKARKEYEQGNDDIMSNFEYDKLYNELEQLENKTGRIMQNSPTINVGYEVMSKLEKRRHNTPMLSLDKTKDINELKSFLKGKEGVLSLKLDGLTVKMVYENGVLIEGVTRGNGEVGEVVTHNVHHFKNIPSKIPVKGRLELRGEALIKYSTFNKINSSIDIESDKYKNPRNLCSGSVRQLDSRIAANRGIIWKGFTIEKYEDRDGVEISNLYDKQLDWLERLGFESVEHYIVTENNIEDTIKIIKQKLETSDIPSDGLVLTFRDTKYGKSLGRTAKAPKHSIAFKWKDEVTTTNLKYIEWSPSRTGLINPIAVFDPVDIEGSTVSRASIHNVSIMRGLELGIGDTLEIYKANLIIPQISENLTRTNTCDVPSTCPCCGQPTQIYEEPVSGVLTLWCLNEDCPAKGNRLFEHFVSRDAMNIEGISKATISTFIEEGIISDLPSIFHIKDFADEIIGLEGFGDKSFENMVNAIEKARSVKLANLIYALGIPNVGLSTAKLICKSFNNDLEKVVTANYSELISIDGIGDTIAESFLTYFNNKDKAEEFVRLIKEVNIIKEEISTNTSMHGVTICVTGDVYIFPNRRVVKEMVENLGGKLTSAVSRSTSYLVTNDTSSDSKKNKDAKKYGIPILTEKEFIDKFNLTV